MFQTPTRNLKKKGGLKVPMFIEAVQSVGRFVKITTTKVHNKNFLKSLELLSRNILMFDKAFNFFHQFAFRQSYKFVLLPTKINTFTFYEVIESKGINYQKLGITKVQSDEIIQLILHSEEENGKWKMKRIQKICIFGCGFTY